METPLELHCVLDCSASMSMWQKLYVARSSIRLLLNQPIFKGELFPALSRLHLWFWGETVSDQIPSAYTNISMDALEDWLTSLVNNSSAHPVRVLLFSDGCGVMDCSNSLRRLLCSKVRMSVIGVGPDQEIEQLKALSSCESVYSTANLDRALSEVLAVPLLTVGQIEQDLAALAPAAAFEPQDLDEDVDEW